MATLRPLPEQQASAPAKAVVVMPGPGGAGRAATVPGGAPGAVRAAGVITLGVEEEFVLLDPSTGAAVLAGPDVVRMLDGEPGVRPELMRFQVETWTGVCTSLDEVGRELVRLRRLAAAAAARLGCRLVACGVAPYRAPGLAAMQALPDVLAYRSRLKAPLVPSKLIDAGVMPGPWRRLVFGHPEHEDGAVSRHAYAFCVLEQFWRHLKRREIWADAFTR